jgi:universal stress protein family protein
MRFMAFLLVVGCISFSVRRVQWGAERTASIVWMPKCIIVFFPHAEIETRSAFAEPGRGGFQWGDRIADEIAREARSWRAGLIATGTHGRRGLGRVVLGSAAAAVLRGAALIDSWEVTMP